MMSRDDSHLETSSLLSLTSAVLMLSTVSPAVKQLIQSHQVNPFELAGLRILIAFACLAAIALVWHRAELFCLTWEETLRLGLLGVLGVGLAYGLGAWALAYTSVVHYTLIYSLLPSLTVALSFLMKEERPSPSKLAGVGLSVTGCLLALSDRPFDREVRFGDLLAVLFTVVAAASIVLNRGTVRHHGAATATTVMFGGSTVVLLLGASLSPIRPPADLSLANGLLIAYLGAATAAAFCLRNLSLKYLPPTTVGAFHNLVPVFGILLACTFLGEPITARAVLGGLIILTGVELVRRS